MGSHASQLTVDERWEVIQYVQRLGRGGDAWSVFQKKNAGSGTNGYSTKTKAPAQVGGGKANPN